MSERLSTELLPGVAGFVKERQDEFKLIPDTRQAELEQFADYVRDCLSNSRTPKLTFICTHNSRRSHFSQIWAKVAADVNGLSRVQTFSGGTEATAMNSRVVESLKRTGFQIDAESPLSGNPRYQVRYSTVAEPISCFSKVYDASPNPDVGYCAVMTCSSADQACPVVPGCELRLPIRYEDPKVADDTPEESARYDERSRQIAREMLFAMAKV